ncbi:hypothetical protein, partial [Thiolapillus sp.]
CIDRTDEQDDHGRRNAVQKTAQHGDRGNHQGSCKNHQRSEQACLRPRDRFWDIPVPKIDSAFDNLFVPQPSWSPSTTQQLRKLVAAPYLSPNDWTPRSNAYFASPLALCARRVSSAASRLLGTTSLRFALHGWQRKNLQTELSLARILLDELIDPATLAALIKEQEKALEEARAD